MHIIISGTAYKEEFQIPVEIRQMISWINHPSHFSDYPDAAAYIDLHFEPGHLSYLPAKGPQTIIVNSLHPLEEKQNTIIRINAWPGMLHGEWLEGSADPSVRQHAETVFGFLGKKVEWLPDESGFVRARIISTIINEAYHALSEGVSSKNEIDTAMKLGTNYPFGPFEWSEKIGLHHVADLLLKLSKDKKRYTPCPLLLDEAGLRGK